MEDTDLVKIAISNIDKAYKFHGEGRVGTAILMKDGNIVTGFNIENRAQKTYHAEEVAIICAIKLGYAPEDFISIAIAYNFSGNFPGCASCRQMLWEYTNPELSVITYSVIDGKGSKFMLKDLYPFPYPSMVIKDEQEKKGESNIVK